MHIHHRLLWLAEIININYTQTHLIGIRWESEMEIDVRCLSERYFFFHLPNNLFCLLFAQPPFISHVTIHFINQYGSRFLRPFHNSQRHTIAALLNKYFLHTFSIRISNFHFQSSLSFHLFRIFRLIRLRVSLRACKLGKIPFSFFSFCK